MAVSNAQIVEFLLANPNMSDADIAAVMSTFGVDPAQVAEATGSKVEDIQSRFEAVAPTVDEPVSLLEPETRVIPTTRGTVIEGDDIEAKIASVPQVVYETRVDPNNKANWETFNPKTGEVIDKGTFAGGGDQGLLRAAAPVVGLAAATVGLPFISSLVGGATGLTGSGLAGATGATIGAGTQAVTGGSAKDIARAALTGGLGGYIGSEVSDLLKTNTPIDASGMTQTQFDASLEGQLVKDMQNAGLTNNQISAFLDDMGIGQGLTVPSTTTPTTGASTVPEVTVTAPATPAPSNLSGVINAISNTVPTVEIKSERPKDTVTPTLLTPSATVPEVTVTGTKPVITAPTTPITPIVPTVPLVLPTIPPAPPTPPTPPAPPPDKTPSISEVLKVIGTVATIGGVANAVTPPKTTYPIVPIPTDWKPPTTQPTSPYQPLTPIDFGNQNLLKGTQWEKFLDPNYGKVPAPTMPTAPASNMSYSNLMDILGSKQGAPMPAGSLSINDIISGIQNQYGQTPQGSMGQKPA